MTEPTNRHGITREVVPMPWEEPAPGTLTRTDPPGGTAERPLAVGAFVTADDHRTPGLFRVVNKGSKNWTIEPVNPDGSRRPGRGARFPGVLLHVVDPADVASAVSAGATGVATMVPFVPDPNVNRPTLHPGTVVTMSTHPGGLFVVLADKFAKVNVAGLGGVDGNRYYRAIPQTLTVVPLTELAARLPVRP